MAVPAFDFAVCGATPFAGLLAGLLATAHGRRVCLVGEPWSPYRLPCRFDISVMPATRPETWALLRQSGAETLKLLGTIGRGLYERIDPVYIAERSASADYLGHMRWVALGLGFAAEKSVDRNLTPGGTIWRIRDAAMLMGGKAEPAIEDWLAASGVTLLAAERTTVAGRRDGTASIAADGETMEAAGVILADDEAILTRLGSTDRHRLLTLLAGVSVLTEPANPQSAALLHYLDREVIVHQRATKGPVLALALGERDSAVARVGASLSSGAVVRRTGQAAFRAVATADGAPLLGRMGRGRMMAIAGLGASAAFFAPALARLLAGAADADEARYFAARDTARAGARQGVAELAMGLEMQP